MKRLGEVPNEDAKQDKFEKFAKRNQNPRSEIEDRAKELMDTMGVPEDDRAEIMFQADAATEFAFKTLNELCKLFELIDNKPEVNIKASAAYLEKVEQLFEPNNKSALIVVIGAAVSQQVRIVKAQRQADKNQESGTD